ncbi:MAG: CcoQ/FixQ family Cbb3-type cytochrome c oxidase assembly chaperone [Bacteroidia bacterium]|nr:CcoQ/FixQ family Cbb3-type cytochrome c oxidase assembly chaperone [Bacteroidia bacterium]NNC86357.1 CcoQ/FixQ family Cbb3-type cytochrome c oxidase assembly chaperone [Bacteroidia bacterium]NNM15545.1 CcoQ/FixQ family Cbb3-type cytochrome c oxidase assembly chaperone [Bacteroidia bacterium]
MLKFVKHHMETITGIEIYPLISFCIFFVFFVVLLVWVMRTNKNHIARMKSLPLNDEESFNN